MASVPYRTSSYGDYLNHVSALIGIDVGDLQATELTFLQLFFNRAIRKIWEMQNWTDLCPYGEVRFPTNLITYPNDYTQTSVWTASNVSVTSKALGNPLDNRTTANSVLETVTSGLHGVSQNAVFLPQQPYNVSGYARPNGRNYLYVNVNDGGATYQCFFNLNSPGSFGAITGTGTGAQVQIQQQAQGFYFWVMSFTASNTAGNGSVAVDLSPDGSTTVYGGNTALGAYFWGITAYLMQNILPAAYIIPWSQTGETAIDTVFSVWGNDPGGSFLPGRVNYNLTPNGIELIGPSSIGPVYTYYRPQRPVFSGNTLSLTANTASGTEVYYTTTAGISDYYTCSQNITAGQTPDTNPTFFSVVPIPYVLFEYCVYNAYADWLGTEGQSTKAAAMYQYAQTCIDDENDKQERQSGNIMPWRVSTHVTSQNRGMGYIGQNFSPVGLFFVN